MNRIIDRLLSSDEPSIRYKVRVGVLGEGPSSSGVANLRGEIKKSARVRILLRDRDVCGRLRPVDHPYHKWSGAHWVFAALADIGYPPGDGELIPIRDQVFECWLSPEAIQERVCAEGTASRRIPGVPVVRGRARRCASQQGNALFSAVVLGLADDRCHQLAECLMRWQWPDGGWNCDRRPEASTSSFWESLIPLRALSAYAKATGSTEARRAAERAGEVFLERRLFRQRRNGCVMNSQFVRLHYPCYWRYDILFGLKVMVEAGFAGDGRCGEALDLLESKRLPDGGWPAEERFYQNTKPHASGYDSISWGGVSKRKSNEWVTADALCVLRASGRLKVGNATEEGPARTIRQHQGRGL
jgi:hypothetical protein